MRSLEETVPIQPSLDFFARHQPTSAEGKVKRMYDEYAPRMPATRCPDRQIRSDEARIPGLARHRCRGEVIFRSRARRRLVEKARSPPSQ